MRAITRCTEALLLLALPLLLGTAAAQNVSILVSFTPPAFSESIAIDKNGNIYVAMPPIGQIRKIDLDNNVSIFASFGGRVLGLAVDAPGNVYAAVNDGARGIWRVAPDGTATQLVAIPGTDLLNGVAFDARGNLYATASFSGTVWRLAKDGTLSAWATGAPLLGDTSCGHPAGPLGANGPAFNKNGDTLYVANTSKGGIAQIPVMPDGSAGIPTWFVGPTCSLVGADGIAFDNLDNLYVALNNQQKIASIDPAGNVTIIASAGAGDPLHAPSMVAFGTGRGDRKTLYITNFGVPPLGGGGQPGVATMDVGIPGRPLP